MIKKVKLLEKEFRGKRTAYSGNCMFLAILAREEDVYDHEAVGKPIYPDGFGCMEPPGPSSGFGHITLTDDEESGKVEVSVLSKRISKKKMRQSLEEYFDGFFIVDSKKKVIEEIDFASFYEKFGSSEYAYIHLVELMPD